MRPGHHAERENQPGRFADRLPVTVGPADQKSEITVAAIAMTPHKIGKGGAVEGFAALIKDDREGLGRKGRNEVFPLLAEALGLPLAPRFEKLTNNDGGNATGAAHRPGASDIIIGEKLLRP